MIVAIAGAGTMGKGIATRALAGGHKVRLVYTNGPKAEALDISNRVDFATFDSLATAPGTSAAEEMARANPDARVVKAFNTTFARTLIADEMAGQPLDVFIAGDDEQAKAQVAELVRGGGRWVQAHCGAPGSWRPSSSCT